MSKTFSLLILIILVLGVSIIEVKNGTIFKAKAATESTSGKIIKVVLDDFKNSTSQTNYYSETSHGTKKISLTSDPETESEIVEVKGPKKLAVILINFFDNHDKPNTKNDINQWTFTAPTSVASYVAENSYGKISLSGNVYGYFTLNASQNYCPFYEWATQADQVAASQGFKPENFDYIMYVYSSNGCNQWAGIGELGGKRSWVNAYMFSDGNPNSYNNFNTPIHELGHNLGAEHANKLSCKDESSSPVSISTSCQSLEYGDTFDTMGNQNTKIMNAPHKIQLGLLPKKEIVTVTTNTTIKIGQLEYQNNLPDGVRVLRKKTANGKKSNYFYLELRKGNQTFDVFKATSNITKGVLIHTATTNPKDQIVGKTNLIDTRPETPTIEDSALTPGNKLFDPESGIEIETISVKANSAEVKITFN